MTSNRPGRSGNSQCKMNYKSSRYSFQQCFLYSVYGQEETLREDRSLKRKRFRLKSWTLSAL